MTLRFGTDGVRGVANVELTPELVLALGRAAPRVLPGRRWLVGRDTRRSGPLVQAALSAGLASEGVSVVDLGVVPTPLVAYLSQQDGVPAAMISASHNPFADNGVKFFAPGGQKLESGLEARLEAELRKVLEGPGGDGSTDGLPGGGAPRGMRVGAPTAEALAGPPSGNFVGELGTDDTAVERYVGHLIDDSLEGRRLDGLHVVIDCANGSVAHLAPEVLRTAGCEVTVLHARPNGSNINAGCGSTHSGDVQRAVPQRRAQVGFAFDGDADRVIAVDAEGHLVDGDQLIAVCALDRRERGLLADDTVVVTVMSNLGFRLGMERRGITVVETDVGDRNVLAALDRGGWNLGGEQSGHIIFRDLATTGDGLLTALQVLDTLVRTGRPLADLASSAMTRLPQVLVNVRLERRNPGVLAAVAPAIAEAEASLGEEGRVLVRASGTEPVVRVMVEAPTRDRAVTIADDLAAAVARACADGPSATHL